MNSFEDSFSDLLRTIENFWRSTNHMVQRMGLVLIVPALTLVCMMVFAPRLVPWAALFMLFTLAYLFLRWPAVMVAFGFTNILPGILVFGSIVLTVGTYFAIVYMGQTPDDPNTIDLALSLANTLAGLSYLGFRLADRRQKGDRLNRFPWARRILGAIITGITLILVLGGRKNVRVRTGAIVDAVTQWRPDMSTAIVIGVVILVALLVVEKSRYALLSILWCAIVLTLVLGVVVPFAFKPTYDRYMADRAKHQEMMGLSDKPPAAIVIPPVVVSPIVVSLGVGSCGGDWNSDPIDGRNISSLGPNVDFTPKNGCWTKILLPSSGWTPTFTSGNASTDDLYVGLLDESGTSIVVVGHYRPNKEVKKPFPLEDEFYVQGGGKWHFGKK